MVLSGTITPLCSLLALGVFARDAGTETLVYVMTGNVVVGLLFGTMHSVQGRVLWLRFQGGLDYVATLPVQRYAFVLAMVLSFLLISLPSVVITMVLGPRLLGMPVALHPLILLVVPACTLPLAGMGAILGLVGRTQRESGDLTYLLSFLLIGLGPVIVPSDRLPAIFTVLGRLSPATYAASALRQTMVGPVTEQIATDLALLAVMTVVFMWLVGLKMNWRQE